MLARLASIPFKGTWRVDPLVREQHGPKFYDKVTDVFKRRDKEIKALPPNVQIRYNGTTGFKPDGEITNLKQGNQTLQQHKIPVLFWFPFPPGIAVESGKHFANRLINTATRLAKAEK